jgi:hypothetical protein
MAQCVAAAVGVAVAARVVARQAAVVDVAVAARVAARQAAVDVAVAARVAARQAAAVDVAAMGRVVARRAAVADVATPLVNHVRPLVAVVVIVAGALSQRAANRSVPRSAPMVVAGAVTLLANRAQHLAQPFPPNRSSLTRTVRFFPIDKKPLAFQPHRQ